MSSPSSSLPSLQYNQTSDRSVRLRLEEEEEVVLVEAAWDTCEAESEGRRFDIWSLSNGKNPLSTSKLSSATLTAYSVLSGIIQAGSWWFLQIEGEMCVKSQDKRALEPLQRRSYTKSLKTRPLILYGQRSASCLREDSQALTISISTNLRSIANDIDIEIEIVKA